MQLPLTRQLIYQRLTDTIFVYEDSLNEYGYNERTAMFNQPNCFGIPVCWCFDRGMDISNFFNDDQDYMFKGLIEGAIELTRIYKTSESQVYWVAADLGKVYMETQCPKLYEFLKQQLRTLV